jgi:hypothetical protein
VICILVLPGVVRSNANSYKHYEFRILIRNNLVSAEAIDIDTEDNFSYVANPQLLAEI